MLVFSWWYEKSNINEYYERYGNNEKRCWSIKIRSK